MDATLILIDGDADLLRARALVDQLWNSTHPGDLARLKKPPPRPTREASPPVMGYVSTVLRIQAAFEEAGIQFTDDEVRRDWCQIAEPP